jgi:hypothetical protein
MMKRLDPLRVMVARQCVPPVGSNVTDAPASLASASMSRRSSRGDADLRLAHMPRLLCRVLRPLSTMARTPGVMCSNSSDPYPSQTGSTV